MGVVSHLGKPGTVSPFSDSMTIATLEQWPMQQLTGLVPIPGVGGQSAMACTMYFFPRSAASSTVYGGGVQSFQDYM